MLNDRYPCSVTIFEGPDGSGKSTLAQAYAKRINARYVHNGPFPLVTHDLARLYAEAMLPAQLGLQAVVLDRSWHSEPIYGLVYRNGSDRVGQARARVLDRLALRCGAVVVRCQPPYEACRDNYRRRKARELLENESQLRRVWDLYNADDELDPHLNEVIYNYTTYLDRTVDQAVEEVLGLVTMMREPCTPHETCRLTAGNWLGTVALVGDSFGPHKNGDPLLQLPFASLAEAGCSLYLAKRLAEAGISEYPLLWVNADELRVDVDDRGGALVQHLLQRPVIALGDVAAQALSDLLVPHRKVAHPQWQKRFANRHHYPLTDLLKELLHGQPA